MPALTELAELRTLVDAARHAPPLPLAAEPGALAAMRDSLDRSGLLLLGEVHGIRQTPRVIAALVELLDVRTLALEWPEQLTVTVDTFRHTGVLDDHDLLWLGDGRLTAGHLALLRELGERRPAVDWLAFDSWTLAPKVPGESEWTARDHAMARRVLDHTDPAGRTLVVAGNAHTPLTRIDYGIPLGAWLAEARPGLRSMRVNYSDGAFYNSGRELLTARGQPTYFGIHLDDDQLLLDHPDPEEADVPHRPDLFPVGKPVTPDVVPAEIEALADDWVAVWNATDATARHDLVARVYAEDAEFFFPSADGGIRHRGRPDIAAGIGQISDRDVHGQGLRIERTGVAVNHRAVRVTWRMVTGDGTTALVGMNLLLLGDATTIAADYLFVG